MSQAASVVAAKQASDADGDNDGSKAGAANSAGKLGPSVILNLTNVAQGDPDHDGH